MSSTVEPGPTAPDPARFCFLESTDSVRSRWGYDKDRTRAYSQLTAETLLNLSLGRQLVVPQSYLFDSYALQLVVRDLNAAYIEYQKRCPHGGRSARPRPVVLHLHKARSYRHAAADQLRRMAAAVDHTAEPGAAPFYSSLYGDLDLGPAAVRRAADLLQEGDMGPFLQLLDEPRAALFESVWGWFGGNNPASLFSAFGGGGGPGLEAMVATLTGTVDKLQQQLRGEDLEDDPVVRRTLRAFAELDRRAGSGVTFGHRSRLYGAGPWDGRKTAEEIVGVDDALLVRETVDTLYNLVVAGSMGRLPSVFSTRMGEGIEADDHEKAQSLALACYRAATGTKGQQRYVEPAAATGFYVELQVQGDTAMVDPPAKLSAVVVEAYTRVLCELDSWEPELEQLRAVAGADADPEDYRSRLELHAKRLAKVLPAPAPARRIPEIPAAVAELVGTTAVDLGLGFIGLGEVATTAFGLTMGGAAIARPVVRRLERRRRLRRVTTRALGEMFAGGGQRIV